MDKVDFFGFIIFNYWVVVIQDSGGYVYIYVVGNVVFGEGKKILFKEMEEDKLFKYCFYYVGYVI